MNPAERARTAMGGGVPDCVPFIPQICPPHAVLALGMDYQSTMLEIVRNPALANDLVFECARQYGVDGVRTWIEPAPRDAVKVHGLWYGQDPETGERLGRIDFEGGGGVLPPEKPTIHTEEDIEAIPVTSADELLASGRLDSAKVVIDKAGDDYFVMSPPGDHTPQYITSLRGNQQAMLDLMDRPDFCHLTLEKGLQIAIENATALSRIGIDALYIGDTFGGVVGPRHFREFFVPYSTRFVNEMRARFAERCPLIYMHICGDSTQLFELMADTGVDCIEPLDPLGGVEVADAKRRVGQRVALMGGMHTAKLAHGTLDEVKADIGRCLSEGAPGGGYILACGDMLPTETSREKVEAMTEAAHSYIYE